MFKKALFLYAKDFFTYTYVYIVFVIDFLLCRPIQ
jgi:hypothetical protein